MTLAGLIVFVVILGVVLALVPMDEQYRKVAFVLVILLVLLVLLRMFAII